MSNSQNIYDNEEFFDGYRHLRENKNSANEVTEKPALRTLFPDLRGAEVLDLGCGYGENCAEFVSLGARRVVGVDISERMLAAAKETYTDEKIEFVRGDMSDLSFIHDTFDVVFSSLAVHYVENFGRLAVEVADRLRPGGYFIFSQEHPLTTAPVSGASWTRDDSGEALHYNLTDYARSGERQVNWIIDGVVKYHRTFSDIVNALLNAGFCIVRMLEPYPAPELTARDPRLKKCLHKPDFLLIKAQKRG